MTLPNQPQVAAAVEAVQQTRRLHDDEAAPWGLRYGQIVDVGSANSAVFQVGMDGDTHPLEAISLVENNSYLTIGTRVAVMSVPPSGNYITAIVTPNLSTTVENFDSTSFNVTSLAFTTAGPLSFCGIAFIAPRSGKVAVHHSAELYNNTAARYTGVGLGVATGSTLGAGTPVIAASFDNAVFIQNPTVGVRAGVTNIATGLTPGDTYNATLYHAVTGGTGTVVRRRVTVVPSI